MSKKTESGNRPTHHAYFVKKDGQNKPRWLELRPVWMHEDDKGFEVILDTLPVGGTDAHRVFSAGLQEAGRRGRFLMDKDRRGLRPQRRQGV